MYYAERASLWLDLRILVTTGLNLFGVPTGLTLALLRIPGGDEVEYAYEVRSVESLLLPQVPQVQPT